MARWGLSLGEVKKAYRKLACKHHPEMVNVNHLGEEIKTATEEKFKKVNEAYEKIKREEILFN